MAAWLKANTQPGDVIFVDQKYPFGFYWQPYAIAEDAAGPSSAGGAAPARYLFVDINTIDQRLDEWAGDAQRVFWLRWFESDTDPRHAVPFLLDKYGKFAGEQVFQGYTLQWWDMTAAQQVCACAQSGACTLCLPAGRRNRRRLAAAGEPASWRPTAGGDSLAAHARRRRGSPLKARVALYDANDGRLVQADERLLNDRHRAPSQWQPGDQPLNVYMLPLPADLAPGSLYAAPIGV